MAGVLYRCCGRCLCCGCGDCLFFDACWCLAPQKKTKLGIDVLRLWEPSGPSWTLLGTVLANLGRKTPSTWHQSGTSWHVLIRCWRLLRRSWRILASLGAILAPSWSTTCRQRARETPRALPLNHQTRPKTTPSKTDLLKRSKKTSGRLGRLLGR